MMRYIELGAKVVDGVMGCPICRRVCRFFIFTVVLIALLTVVVALERYHSWKGSIPMKEYIETMRAFAE